MRVCPITYEPLAGTDPAPYSAKGLRSLSPELTALADLPYTAAEQRREAVRRAGKMSVQGAQPKLSAVLRVRSGHFEIVDQGGRYLLKPQVAEYERLPENEDVTMRLAASAGIEVPLHGLVRSKDGQWTYFIRRFDRIRKKAKLQVEDFAQLSGATRDTKYKSSMERVARVVEEHTTFPLIEKERLLRRTLFSFLVGNEDLHLKHFSLIVRGDGVALSPAYDLLNSTLAGHDKEELALPLNGKKSKLTRRDLIDYYGAGRLGLQPGVVAGILAELATALPRWLALLDCSFLTPEQRHAYVDLIEQRSAVLA